MSTQRVYRRFGLHQTLWTVWELSFSLGGYWKSLAACVSSFSKTNVLNYLMLCSWWWKTLHQVLPCLLRWRDVNIFMHRKKVFSELWGVTDWDIVWEVTLGKIMCMLEVLRSSFRITGNASLCPTCFQLTLDLSFIKLSCLVRQLWL